MKDDGFLCWYETTSIRAWLMLAAVVGVATFLLTPSSWGAITRGIAGWNAAVIFWITLVGLLSRGNSGQLARRAARYNVGWLLMLTIVSTAVMASLGAIVVLLSHVKNMPLAEKTPHLLGSIATIALSWIALHTLYTFVYLHYYYVPTQSASNDPCRLIFPATPAPTFADFLYFSFTIGATSQTSDIVISSPSIRRVVTAHAMLSFAFNTALLAITINIAAGVV